MIVEGYVTQVFPAFALIALVDSPFIGNLSIFELEDSYSGIPCITDRVRPGQRLCALVITGEEVYAGRVHLSLKRLTDPAHSEKNDIYAKELAHKPYTPIWNT